MIEVIGEDESKRRQTTCKNCTSILRFVNLDVKSYDKRDYIGDLDTYHYVECPKCKEKCFVKSRG